MEERGSDKHGPRIDEDLKEEIDGVLKSGGPTRAEEWREPEPVVDDQGIPATDREAVQREEESE
ncbi:hypothetical protein NI17_021145 [Thermobifida halotolerans]|uniref:Uncharacterized protein n=1 Tax=Thermobifida halotolerans TaxID=483545 RepID=A0A399G0K3_9ACTN|nr:hypothetical protein [Thermobifida halotolerans]UOE19224.1 hypothetical protein NI17_021145 [Thermobifida halotolerans]